MIGGSKSAPRSATPSPVGKMLQSVMKPQELTQAQMVAAVQPDARCARDPTRAAAASPGSPCALPVAGTQALGNPHFSRDAAAYAWQRLS